MPAKSFNYIEFLFNQDATLKTRIAPVVSYISKTDSFILKYSVPGYHVPRQYFKFAVIPEQFPNEYVAEIFRIFSITDSFLNRHPKARIPDFKKSIVYDYFDVDTVPVYDPEEIETAKYNLELALKLGRQNHSLFYFDSYLEAYKVLHPEIKLYSKNVIRRIQGEFNKLISS